MCIFLNSLCYHEPNRHEYTDEGCENAHEEERLDLLTLPQFHRRFAAFGQSEFHDVKHKDELHNRQNREKGTEWKPNPQDELIKDQA